MFQLPIILFIFSLSFMELLSFYNFFELQHSSKAFSVTLRDTDHTAGPKGKLSISDFPLNNCPHP